MLLKKSNPYKAALVTGTARLMRLRMKDLAAECGVHLVTLCRVARGEKSSARVDRYLAKKLGIRLDTLRTIGTEKKGR